MVCQQEKTAFGSEGGFFLSQQRRDYSHFHCAFLLLSVVKALREAFSILAKHAFVNPWL